MINHVIPKGKQKDFIDEECLDEFQPCYDFLR